MELTFKHSLKTMGTRSYIRQIEWRSILEWFDLKKGEWIFDVAYGRGVLNFKIDEMGCEVHGFDLSGDAINSAKRLSEKEMMTYEFWVESAENLPYPDRYFDKIVCSSSVEHF